MYDDPRERLLDAIEFWSEITILNHRQVFGPVLELIWHLELLFIPYEGMDLMDGVVGIPLVVLWLRDAREISYVVKCGRASSALFLPSY